MISCPGLSEAATASTALTTYERSGSFVFLSGVGTQMSMASMAPSWLMSAVARRRPALTMAATSASGTSGMIAAAGVDLRVLRGIDVEAGDVEAGAGEFHGERQPDVAQTDDADSGLLRSDALDDVCLRCGQCDVILCSQD